MNTSQDDLQKDSIFTAHLGPGEKLMWTGRPKQGFQLKTSDVLLIPFSLLWGGGVLYWEITTFNTDVPFLYTLIGIPFLLAGLYLIIGRFFYDRLRRKNTHYGISAERIIIHSGIWERSFKSHNIKAISDFALTEKEDGSGTVVIGPERKGSRQYRGTGWPLRDEFTTPSLEMIQGAKKVFQMIKALQETD